LSKPIEADSIGEHLAAEGCSYEQMRAVERVFSALEHEFRSVHMQIIALRSLAYCQDARESFERCSDTLSWSSSKLLEALKSQRDAIGVLIGKKREEL
jgi:hypothetical protein